jgi:transcriptional regulator NrdR family protein
MQCPKCNGRATVYATKPAGTLKQRYRKCGMCDHRFSTWEEVEDRKLRRYDAERKSTPNANSSGCADLFENMGKKAV